MLTDHSNSMQVPTCHAVLQLQKEVTKPMLGQFSVFQMAQNWKII